MDFDNNERDQSSTQGDPSRALVERFGDLAQNPAFRQKVRQLTQLTGAEPCKTKRPGVQGFILRRFGGIARHFGFERDFLQGCRRDDQKFERIYELVLELQNEMHAAGFYLIQSELFDATQTRLMLYPTDDPFAVLYSRNTRGEKKTIRTRQIVQWLRDFARSHPFTLIAAGTDFVEGHLLTPMTPEQAEHWAPLMYAFCPDIVDQGCKNVEALAEELIQSQRIYFWWD